MEITANGRRYIIDEGLYEDICNAISSGYTLEEELEDIRDGWDNEWGNVEDAIGTCEMIWDDLKAEFEEERGEQTP